MPFRKRSFSSLGVAELKHARVVMLYLAIIFLSCF